MDAGTGRVQGQLADRDSHSVGPEVAEPQLWQDPVPPVDHELIDDKDIVGLKGRILGSGLSVPQLVSTAWASASTFRGSDKRGGANGARIRLEPQRGWAANEPEKLAGTLAALEKVYADYAEPDADFDALIEEQGRLQEFLDHHDAWNLDSRLEMAMGALRCPPGDTEVKVLSGGEESRLALAKMLLRTSNVLLLDEPLSALDAKLREAMQLELAKLQDTVGITFVIVTHDQREALSVALAAEADGVHVGQGDMPAAEVRARIGPGKLLGLSVETEAQAREIAEYREKAAKDKRAAAGAAVDPLSGSTEGFC